MSVKVCLRVHVGSRLDKYGGCVMERRIEMPFPPTKDMEIWAVFQKGSDAWETQVEKVVWDHERQEYVAWLCDDDCNIDPLQEVLKRDYGDLWTENND